MAGTVLRKNLDVIPLNTYTSIKLCFSGIGKETARDLNRRGAKVIMACRNMEAAKTAAEEIQSSNNNENGDNGSVGELVVAKLDLSSLKSVRAFAQHVIQDEERLDILINNAGVGIPLNKELSEDGFELTIAVNHIGPFLLTNLLREKLAESPGPGPARVVTVASKAHTRGKINIQDLNGDGNYNGGSAYNQSKLANILFTKELAERVKAAGQNISVYSLHPGVIHTNLLHQFAEKYGFLANGIWLLMWPFLKSCREGAQTTIFCAVEDSIANDSGLYYVDCSEAIPSSQALDKDIAKNLWELSEKLVSEHN